MAVADGAANAAAAGSAPFRSIVITGASSGIGAALARLYAAPGVRLGLIGQNAGRLAAVAADAAAKGAQVESALLDVSAGAAMQDWLAAFEAAGPVDMVFANAGISTGLSPTGTFESTEDARRVLSVNTLGAINTVMPLVPSMQARRRGHIVLVSSLAGLRGLGEAPAYSASKAAIKEWGIALRDALKADGVKVTVVCPGFVQTPMGDQFVGAKMFVLSADQAAARIARAVAANRRLAAFPLPLALSVQMLAHMPERLARLMLKITAFRVRSRAQ